MIWARTILALARGHKKTLQFPVETAASICGLAFAVRAEGTGLEPATPFGAIDFESTS